MKDGLTIKHLEVSRRIFEQISLSWKFKLEESIALLGFDSFAEYDEFYKRIDDLDDKTVCIDGHQLDIALRVSYLMSIIREVHNSGSIDYGAELIRRKLPKFGDRIPYQVFVNNGVNGMSEFREFLYSIR